MYSQLIDKLLKFEVHLGHSNLTKAAHEFIFAKRHQTYLIDLEKTVYLLQRALQFLIKISQKKDSQILFVIDNPTNTIKNLAKNSKKTVAQNIIHANHKITPQQDKILSTDLKAKLVIDLVKKFNQAAVVNKWTKGFLTNNIFKKTQIVLKEQETYKKTIELISLTQVQDKQKLYSKAELAKTIKLSKPNFGYAGQNKFILYKLQEFRKELMKPEKKLPDLIILFTKNQLVVNEAAALNIPLMGLVDTNNDFSKITYPIPSNDDSIKTLYFFIKLIEKTLLIATK
jgi:ribosomal protein S2